MIGVISVSSEATKYRSIIWVVKLGNTDDTIKIWSMLAAIIFTPSYKSGRVKEDFRGWTAMTMPPILEPDWTSVANLTTTLSPVTKLVTARRILHRDTVPSAVSMSACWPKREITTPACSGPKRLSCNSACWVSSSPRFNRLVWFARIRRNWPWLRGFFLLTGLSSLNRCFFVCQKNSMIHTLL